MTPLPPRGHRGLAQRVRALFDDPPVPGPSDSAEPIDVAWVSETGRPLGAGATESAAAEPLAEAVEAYVLAGPGGGEEIGEALDQEIAAARRGPASSEKADAVEALLRYAARDESALDRARALVTPGVAALLVRRLTEVPDEDRRNQLLQRLPDLGEEIREATLDALRMPPAHGVPQGSAATRLLRLLATLARNSPGMLEDLAEDPDWRVVSAVLSIASDRGGEGALLILTLALDHDHPRVRTQALSALRKLGGGEAGELALGMLEDRDPSVRAEAARTVGGLNVARGLVPLLGRLESDDHPEVLVATVQALGELRDPAAIGELEGWTVPRVTGEHDHPLRSAAFLALHRIGTPRAIRILEQASGDSDPRIRALLHSLPGTGSARADADSGEGGATAE